MSRYFAAGQSATPLLFYYTHSLGGKERLNNMHSAFAWAAAALSYFHMFGWGFTAAAVSKEACVS
jgi:hypothetical protein